MPIITRSFAKCDRCGVVVEGDVGELRPLTAMPRPAGDSLAGWAQLCDGTCLCAECHRGYDALRRRQEREMRDYLGRQTVEVEI